MALLKPLRHPHDREILRLAIPAFAALVAEPLFLLSDSAIVGHLGKPALAGLGVSGQALSTIVGLCVFLAYGTTAAVSRQVGAGDHREAIRRGIDGVWLAAAIGLVLVVVGRPLTPWIVAAIGASAQVAPPAETYLAIGLLGAPGMLIMLAGTGVLRGLQDTRGPLLVSVGAFTLNLALNVLFVLVLGWGIAGSAWGTVIAQTTGAAVYVALIARGARSHDVSLRPNGTGVRTSATAGVSLIVRTATLQAALVAAASVAARIGDAELAAYAVGSRIWLFLAFALDAIAIAGQAITGRHLGSADIAGVRAATRRMLQWGVFGGVVFGAAVLVLRPWLPGLFTTDPAVARLLLSSLIVVALMQPLAGAVFVLDGVLIGAGDSRYLALAGVGTAIVFLPAAWLVYGLSGGIVALWLAISLWIAVRFTFLWLRSRRDTWLVTGAVRD